MSPENTSDISSEEAASKKKKAPAHSWAPGVSVPASPSNGSLTPTSTASSSSKHDPKALLNPKSNALPPRNKRDTPSEEDSIDDATNGLGMSSMLSQVHGLKSRENAPKKRRKIDDPEIGEDEARSKSTSERVDTGGQMGHALKEEQRRLQESQPVQSSSMVDLTAEDDDDDECVLVEPPNKKPNNEDDQEVCLGKIPFSVVASLIPGPKPESRLQPTATKWPAMKLDYRIGAALIITLIDPARRHFAKVDFRTAGALKPLLISGLGVRAKFTLDARPRLSSENPGSPTSARMKVTTLLFAPRKHNVQIGRMLTLKSVKLEDTNAGFSYLLVNPHSVTNTNTPPSASAYAFGAKGFTIGTGYINRTNEEVTSDVLNMFDSIIKTEDLPEMEGDPRITTDLLKHQKQGLYFMTNREKIPLPNADNSDDGFVLWRSKVKGNGVKIWYNVISGHEASHRPPPIRGGILADMMGLGKTLSILAMLVGTLEEAVQFATFPPPRTAQRALVRNSKATLLVCPVSTVSNWEDQVKTHIAPNSIRYYIYHGASRCQDIEELAEYDLIITSYHTMAAEKTKGGKRPIWSTNFFRIVLDEAHQIRTPSTAMAIAVCELEAQRRWAVSGTPIQNRLEDLGSLIKFLRIQPFDQKGAFTQFIVAPFKQADPEILPKLRLLVDSITLRRQKDHITLPERSDKIVRLDHTKEEDLTYQFFLADSQAKIKAISAAGARLRGKQTASVLKTILRLRLLCVHGEEMLSDTDRKLMTGISSNNAIDLTEDDAGEPAMSQQQAFEMLELLRDSEANECSMCQKKIEPNDDDEDDEDYEVRSNTNTMGYLMNCNEIFCTNCFPAYMEEVAQVVGEDNYLNCPRCQEWVKNSWFELKASEFVEWEQAKARVRANPKLAKQLGYYHGPHTKTKTLVASLLSFNEWSANNPDEAPIKSVVFSYWTTHLDLIQYAFEANNITYTRLDGKMARKARGKAIEAFRDDPEIQVILVSIGAGGVGLNLTAASKVFMMEPQYNPAAEAQAVERVHRLGQVRDVEIVRYIMRGSIEEAILEVQKAKTEMADMTMNRNHKVSKAQEQMETLQRFSKMLGPR
ncbi:hypothetical protein BLS_008668 [Venturia inaequalis]|uniref:Uncharacterized protein n=1 Tax=Venturia inaequalis TaxID=5025 RepID=A0A8H3YMZ2_VENIN|nr:hypothetical protein BLS_008668 [Venturia inaequalis]